jgi:hypothetical protein
METGFLKRRLTMAYGTMSIGNVGFTKKIISTLFLLMHPVGTPYASENATSPAELYGGTWERIENCTIWGASSLHPAGTTLEAGLPNITAKVTSQYGIFNADSEGAFYFVDGANYKYPATGLGGALIHDLRFSAANSNSIYGKSTTVQPPAYCMYLWRRVA